MYVRLDSSRVDLLREERGFSRSELARRASLARSTIRAAEAGKPVRLKTARSVAAALGLEDARTLGR